MDDIKQDSRFAHIAKDPRFRRMHRKDRKVKIDKRFKGMFNDSRFKLKYSVDKRGRPIHSTTNENLKKYYDLSESGSEDDDDDNKDDVEEKEQHEGQKKKDTLRKKGKADVKKKKIPSQKVNEGSSGEESADEKVDEDEGDDDEESEDESLSDDGIDMTGDTDYARGGGQISSTDDDLSDDGGETLELPWGEIDHDAPIVTETTPRLAVCNMDWDRIKAQDLIVLFNSFTPTGGVIKSVVIYPSDYGAQRMKEEALKGPTELVTKKTDVDESKSEEEQHKENLRIYQLNRLKYYYAVVECDSKETANHIYTSCDGVEYEGSANKLDLRFIPDDMTFDQEPKSQVFDVPDVSSYKPTDYVSSALQQSKVNLTWDETEPTRLAMTMRKFTKEDLETMDLQDYLASDSDHDADPYAGIEEPDLDSGSNEDDEEAQIKKYRALLQGVQDTDKAHNDDLEMEISWEPGLKETTKDLVRKSKDKSEPTPWEKYLEKSKEKSKKKKKNKHKNEVGNGDEQNDISDDDIPGGVDMDDPYFKEEFDNMKANEERSGKKKRKKEKKKQDLDPEAIEEQKQREAELGLLMSDDEDARRHFSLRDIMEEEKEVTGRKKRRRQKLKEKMAESKAKKEQGDDFQMNVTDPRFKELYKNPLFNIDPTAPEFKKTKAIDLVIKEKLKRRTEEISRPHKSGDSIDSPSKKPRLNNKDTDIISTEGQKDLTLAHLVKSVKAKTKSVQDKHKRMKKGL